MVDIQTNYLFKQVVSQFSLYDYNETGDEILMKLQKHNDIFMQKENTLMVGDVR